MALGISGEPTAYAALVEFGDTELEGEVGAAQYRAQRAVPLAIGHLARSDPRALQFLLEAARREKPEAALRWSYLHLRGPRLASIFTRAAITGLGMSGRPEAVAALRYLGDRARRDPSATSELRTHFGAAERLCDRVAREGPDRVFDEGSVR